MEITQRINAGYRGSSGNTKNINTSQVLLGNCTYLIDTTSAAFTVYLPQAPANGTVVRIINPNSSFATNNLTVSKSGSDTVDGSATIVLSENNKIVDFLYASLLGKWVHSNNNLTSVSGIVAGGELAGTYPNPTVLNSAVIGKVLTGYTSGAGTIAASDTILQAIQKLNGNTVALTSSGTTNYISKFSSGSLVNSQIFDSGSFVGIRATAASAGGEVIRLTGDTLIDGNIIRIKTSATASLTRGLYFTPAEHNVLNSIGAWGSSGGLSLEHLSTVTGTIVAKIEIAGGNLVFYSQSGSTFAERMRIVPTTGNVGIGTASPIILFQTKVASNTNIGFTTRGANISGISSFNDAGGGFQNLHIDGTFISLQGNSSGNVGINTTTDAGYRLDVNGTAIFRGKTIIGAADVNAVTLAVNQDGANSEFYVGTNSVANTQRLFISQARRSNYGDMMIGLNLTGQSGSDAFVTRASGGGYSGINFSYDGNIDFYARTVATTSGSVVTPTSRININGTTGNVTISGALTLSTALTVPNGGTGLTSLTAGYIPFGNGTGSLSSSSSLKWDDTNKRLSIGTITPTYDFHIEKTVNGTVNLLILNQSTGNNGGAALDIGRSLGAEYYATIHYANENNTTFTPLSLNIQNRGGSTGGMFINNLAAAPIVLSTANTTRLTIGSTGIVTVANTTASTSTTTGALVVSGGVGIAGALYTGTGIVNATGSVYLPNSTSIYFRNGANSTYLRALRFASDNNVVYGEDSNISYISSTFVGIGTGSIWSKLTIGGGNVTLLNNISIQGVNAAGSTFFGLIKVATDDRVYINEDNREVIIGGKTGIGITPTAVLHLKAGTATANTAPLKFTSQATGAVLTTPEEGAVEFSVDNYFLTSTTSTIRKTINDLVVRNISASRTLDGSDECVNVTSGTFPVTLPTAVAYTKQYIVKNSGTGITTINTTSSQTIDNNASGTLTLSQYESITLRSDGTNWFIV